jgi:hypothetical protein
MNEEIQLYANCMEEVRDRVNFVKSVGAHRVTTGRKVFDIEVVFLQLRKILELVAFASLSANKEKYSAAHEKFAAHWKAKLMLQELEKINPDFYPMPIGQPQLQADGTKHCPAITEGFLTRTDFELLYDIASQFVHTRNPFCPKDPMLLMPYSMRDWISRIRALLALHIIHLVDGKKWIVQIPEEGVVRVYTAEPVCVQ